MNVSVLRDRIHPHAVHRQLRHLGPDHADGCGLGDAVRRRHQVAEQAHGAAPQEDAASLLVLALHHSAGEIDAVQDGLEVGRHGVLEGFAVAQQSRHVVELGVVVEDVEMPVFILEVFSANRLCRRALLQPLACH